MKRKFTLFFLLTAACVALLGTTKRRESTKELQTPKPPTVTQTVSTSSGQGPSSERPSVEVVWASTPEAGTAKTLNIKGVEYAFRYCPAGTFTMGSPEGESGRTDYETQHRVTLDGFWMLETEVTQGMWQAVMGTNPSQFTSSERNPVEQVSWNDCQDFIKKLNSLGVAPNGFQFRLPTEAEWEYACRAGSDTAYFWGDSLNGDKANCYGSYPYGTSTKGKYLGRTTAVGSYAPNAWGLHDMHGNVWEWCEDWFANDYYKKSNTARILNYVAFDTCRVCRGGSWSVLAGRCRSANRDCGGPTGRGNDCGFRLVLVRPSASK